VFRTPKHGNRFLVGGSTAVDSREAHMERIAFDGRQPGGPVGYFTYDVDEDERTWSDGMYQLHGYTPQEVAATTELPLSHKHPDDRSRALGVFEDVVRTGEPFSCYHRIIDHDGHVRSIISVGPGIKDHDGRVRCVDGFFVDLTTARRDETQAIGTLPVTRGGLGACRLAC
jgi:PAS domain S-box-containing protein